MSKKLFVGGIAWETTEDGLRETFGEFGSVMETKIIMDHDTGRSRGFGFVTFADAEDASHALQKMNGTDLDGRTIRVDLATDKRNGDGNRRRRSRPNGNR